MTHLNTCDKSLRSFVDSAEDPNTDFPIQNLPFGIFSRGNRDEPRIGVAIGDSILDVRAAAEGGFFAGLSDTATNALLRPSLNEFAALGSAPRLNLRRAMQALLGLDGPIRSSVAGKRLLLPQRDAQMHLPFAIGDYTDFYASLHHATNVGTMFRPTNPLFPNWKHLPVGYHGRSSSIVVSGTPLRRPSGQVSKSEEGPPSFAPSMLLDYELEVGAFMATGNALGSRIPIERAWDSVFGLVLLNDWSARDIQRWEYQPLGPFNAKNFGSTISPWVVTLEALAPFMLSGPPRGKDDPPTLDYLKSGDDVVIDIRLEVWLATQSMREKASAPFRVSQGTFADMYWTIAQMVAHHTSTGCNLRTGDLLGSGTVSGPTPESRGCMIERTWRGTEPLTLPDGSERKFLADGDEVIMRGFCAKSGFRRIGFGDCRGTIVPNE
ncbi:MAG: fumarylacetoacetase [Phycisphaerae bacterium]|nr:fumarylacetoacetase [Phycisphaerae bacterium]